MYAVGVQSARRRLRSRCSRAGARDAAPRSPGPRPASEHPASVREVILRARPAERSSSQHLGISYVRQQQPTARWARSSSSSRIHRRHAHALSAARRRRTCPPASSASKKNKVRPGTRPGRGASSLPRAQCHRSHQPAPPSTQRRRGLLHTARRGTIIHLAAHRRRSSSATVRPRHPLKHLRLGVTALDLPAQVTGCHRHATTTTTTTATASLHPTTHTHTPPPPSPPPHTTTSASPPSPSPQFHCVWMGDLNPRRQVLVRRDRRDGRRGQLPTSSRRYTAPHTPTERATVTPATPRSHPRSLTPPSPHPPRPQEDQLKKEMAARRVFAGFRRAGEISTFAPTYRVRHDAGARRGEVRAARASSAPKHRQSGRATRGTPDLSR